MALAENPTLAEYSGFVQDSGEGRWTIQAAIDEAVPVDVLSAALYRALPFAPGAHIRGKNALRHAAKVWRARRTRKKPAVSHARNSIGRKMSKTGNHSSQLIPARQACRSLRHGDLRRSRRPRQAQADSLPSTISPSRNCFPANSPSSAWRAAPCRTKISARRFPPRTSRNLSPARNDPDLWEWFIRRLYYVDGEFPDKNIYPKLADTLKKVDQRPLHPRQLFFLHGDCPGFFWTDRRRIWRAPD